MVVASCAVPESVFVSLTHSCSFHFTGCALCAWLSTVIAAYGMSVGLLAAQHDSFLWHLLSLSCFNRGNFMTILMLVCILLVIVYILADCRLQLLQGCGATV